MKKTWQPPQLVILTRSKPEEAVLTGCKTEDGVTGMPSTVALNCCVRCDQCLSLDIS